MLLLNLFYFTHTFVCVLAHTGTPVHAAIPSSTPHTYMHAHTYTKAMATYGLVTARAHTHTLSLTRTHSCGAGVDDRTTGFVSQFKRDVGNL